MRKQSRFLPILNVILCVNVILCGTSFLSSSSAVVQGGKAKAKQGEDPYTLNDPKLMKKLGYVSFGPFDFADGATTGDIETFIREEHFLWVETAHFKIGSGLSMIRFPSKNKERKKIKDELAKLGEKIPAFKKRHKYMRPWLRLHLFAARLEKLYADLSELLGVSDADFQKKKVNPGDPAYMGQGPYLGQEGKFTVILFRKESGFARFFQKFADGKLYTYPRRHHFLKSGNIFFGSCEEFADGTLAIDAAMHGSVVYNVTQNLLNGYKMYYYNIPVWVKTGLAHYYQRKLNPKWNSFDQIKEYGASKRKEWNWKPKVRGRVKHKVFTPFSVVCKWMDYSKIEFLDHLMVWSRMDFLMSLEPEFGEASEATERKRKFATYMNLLSNLVTSDETGWHTPDAAAVLEQQTKAIQAAWGMDPEALDEAWSKFVLEKYPTR